MHAILVAIIGVSRVKSQLLAVSLAICGFFDLPHSTDFRFSTHIIHNRERIMATERKDQVPSPAQGVGPFYRPEGEKPTATVSKEVSYDNVHVLPQTPQLIALLTYGPRYA